MDVRSGRYSSVDIGEIPGAKTLMAKYGLCLPVPGEECMWSSVTIGRTDGLATETGRRARQGTGEVPLCWEPDGTARGQVCSTRRSCQSGLRWTQQDRVSPLDRSAHRSLLHSSHQRSNWGSPSVGADVNFQMLGPRPPMQRTPGGAPSLIQGPPAPLALPQGPHLHPAPHWCHPIAGQRCLVVVLLLLPTIFRSSMSMVGRFPLARVDRSRVAPDFVIDFDELHRANNQWDRGAFRFPQFNMPSFAPLRWSGWWIIPSPWCKHAGSMD